MFLIYSLGSLREKNDWSFGIEQLPVRLWQADPWNQSISLLIRAHKEVPFMHPHLTSPLGFALDLLLWPPYNEALDG